MRILTAVSRRGIDLPFIQAEPAEHTHQATLLLDVNPKQVGQLCRDWHAIVDVTDVRADAALQEILDQPGAWTVPAHPPASSAGISEGATGRAALA